MSLETFLQEKGIRYEKHAHPVTYTAQALADAEHVSGYMVAKPVVVTGAKGHAVCVLPAPRHLDLQKVASALGWPVTHLATEEQMAALFPDCELGAEPPIGALYGLPTVMEQELEGDEFLVMQAGSHREAVKVDREDWQRAVRPIVAPIAAG
jgi:Ala-tRNA(Pro) deacylase